MKTPPIPVALLNTAFSLTVDRNPDPEFKPSTIRLHELFDFTNQSGGRIVEFDSSPDDPGRVYLVNSRHAEDYSMVLGAERGIAAASWLATVRLEALVASLPQADILGTLKAAAEKTLPGRTIAGFALVSPDASEFIAMRAGPFWPDLNGCGRLGTACSYVSLAEALYWPDPNDACAVTVARTAYQRLPTVDFADEVMGRMGHAGMSMPMEYLWSDHGDGVPIRTYTCFAEAENDSQWSRWKEALLANRLPAKDGSTFVLLTRDEVYNLIDDEANAARVREVYIAGTTSEEAGQALRLELQAVERSEVDVDEQARRVARREHAKNGRIPTKDRGAFPFFDAQASAFKAILQSLA